MPEQVTTTVETPPSAPVPSPPKGPATARPSPIPSKAVALNTPLPLRKPAVTSLDEAQIVGAEGATLLSLFGEPDTVTTKAPSQTWFYASGPCRLFIQLFKDLDSGAFRALKYSIEGGSTQRCLAQFEHLGSAQQMADETPPEPLALTDELSEGR
ncbi:MAG: hypothetical protein AAF221_05155 [Pseudomonadota bacterium]